MDITDEEALSNLLSVVVQHNGSIDYLFNAASITIAQADVVRYQGHAGHSPSGINQPNCKPCLSYCAAR